MVSRVLTEKGDTMTETKRETIVRFTGEKAIIGRTLTGMTHNVSSLDSNSMPYCNMGRSRMSPRVTTAKEIENGAIVSGHLCKKCFGPSGLRTENV